MASVSVNQKTKGRGLPWRVMWRDTEGQQRQKTFDLKRDADAFASTLEVELRVGTYIDPSLRRTTFEAQYDSWRAARRVSEARRGSEESLAKTHVLPRWGGLQLGAIDHDAVQAWVNHLREAPREVKGKPVPAYSWETVSACKQIVNGVMTSAVRARKIPNNPVVDVTVPDKPRRDITSDDVLDPSEVARLEGKASSRWRVWFHCSAWLGWRLSEGLRIERRDVDLKAGTITIRGTKTAAATRIIPLPAVTLSLLREHMRLYVLDPTPNALVFSTTGKVMDRSVMRRQLQLTLKRADLLGRGIDYRQLRHTSASLMLAAGVNPVDVSYRMGHARPSITTDIYTHLLPRVTEEGTARLDALMRG